VGIRRERAVRSPVMLVLAFVVLLPSCRKVDGLGPDDRQLPVDSRFTASMENWTVGGDGVLFHTAQGGNPGGYVYAVDQVNGPPQHFIAPARFLGDVSEAFGRLLSFDMMWIGDSPDEQPEPVKVVLKSGALTLVKQFAEGPGADWTSFSVRLDESGDWRHETTEAVATASQIQQVLAQLQQLVIRAEFNEGEERTSLDNVVLGAELSS
jgi:hypothetical protein